MDVFAGIRDSYFAAGLSDDEVRAVAAIAELVPFTDMETVLEDDDTAESIYVLLSGKVEVTTMTGELIARLKVGELFGEIALFEGGRRSAQVIGQGEGHLARISATSLNALMDGRPEIGVVILRNLGRTLCDRLRSSNIQLESVLQGLG
jgi:CRP-like cAMP-binding protein